MQEFLGFLKDTLKYSIENKIELQNTSILYFKDGKEIKIHFKKSTLCNHDKDSKTTAVLNFDMIDAKVISRAEADSILQRVLKKLKTPIRQKENI